MSGLGRQPSRQRLQGGSLMPQLSPEEVPAPDYGADDVPSSAVQERPPQASAGPLYGLAADLAGLGPMQPAGQGGSLIARQPARLGSGRTNRFMQPTRADGVRVANALNTANAKAQTAAGPFSLAETQRQQPPTGPNGEMQYGLALELLDNRNPGFPDVDPTSKERKESVGRSPRKRTARLGLGQRADVMAPSQPPPLNPFIVMEMAASQAGLPEPDYGIVAELRNREPPDPFASGFGLAAEMARRRSRSPTTIAPGGHVLPPVRARQRLDPVMPPQRSEGGAGFGLADEVAARQQQDAADVAEPFGAAARAGELDPFALADEQLKVPRELLEPYEATQQEMPSDDVRLKAPGDDASEASAFSRDKEHYGIAQELGADKATEMRKGVDAAVAQLPGQPGSMEQMADPPGHKYTYDEDTGMLTTTAGGQGDGSRVARQYIEDEVTGIFYKLQSKRRKLFGLLRRKPHAIVEEDEDEEDDKGFRGRLRLTLLVLTNICNILGMFAQGLLAGFALLNFFMTYMLYSSSNMRKFLSYYAPLAQNNNRIYYVLVTLSIISSTSRLAQSKLRRFEPRRLQLGPVNFVQMLFYVGAYVASVLCTPLDDELTYESNRNPRFYELTWTSAFKRRVSTWHALNIIRTVLVGLAWLLTCYQTSPYIFDATLRTAVRGMRRELALLYTLSGPGAVGTAHKVS